MMKNVGKTEGKIQSHYEDHEYIHKRIGRGV